MDLYENNKYLARNFTKDKIKFFLARSVFPNFKHDELTMLIFSYIDVQQRAMNILKILNTKGRSLS